IWSWWTRNTDWARARGSLIRMSCAGCWIRLLLKGASPSVQRRQCGTETVDLCLTIVIVHRGAYDAGEATRLHIEACGGEAGDGDVDVLPGQSLTYLVSFMAVNRKTHNATAFSPWVAHCDSRQGGEALA